MVLVEPIINHAINNNNNIYNNNNILDEVEFLLNYESSEQAVDLSPSCVQSPSRDPIQILFVITIYSITVI